MINQVNHRSSMGITSKRRESYLASFVRNADLIIVDQLQVQKGFSTCRIISAVHFAPINAVSPKRNNSPA
jgi:hypothetical protein